MRPLRLADCLLPPHAVVLAQGYRLVRRAMVGHDKANKADAGPERQNVRADNEFERLMSNGGDGIHSEVFMDLAAMFCTDAAFQTANGGTMEVLANLQGMIMTLKELQSKQADVAPEAKRGKTR